MEISISFYKTTLQLYFPLKHLNIFYTTSFHIKLSLYIIGKHCGFYTLNIYIFTITSQLYLLIEVDIKIVCAYRNNAVKLKKSNLKQKYVF